MFAILFESPITLGVFAGLANFFLLVYWRKTGKPVPLLIGLAVGAGLLVTQALVVTSREQAAALLTRIERDLLSARVEALDEALARDFRAGPYDHAGFVAFARRRLQSLQIRWLRRSHLQVRRTGEAMQASVGYIGAVRAAGFAGTVRTRWSLTFLRQDGQWRIGSIDPPTIEARHYRQWRELGP